MSCKGQAKHFDISNKKFKNRYEKINCILTRKDSLIFDFYYFPDNTDDNIKATILNSCMSTRSTEHRFYVQVLCLSVCVRVWLCCVGGFCLHDDSVCTASVSYGLRLLEDCQSHRGGLRIINVCSPGCVCVCLCESFVVPLNLQCLLVRVGVVSMYCKHHDAKYQQSHPLRLS